MTTSTSIFLLIEKHIKEHTAHFYWILLLNALMASNENKNSSIMIYYNEVELVWCS